MHQLVRLKSVRSEEYGVTPFLLLLTVSLCPGVLLPVRIPFIIQRYF